MTDERETQLTPAGSSVLDKLPPGIGDFIKDYIFVSKKLLLSPVVFYREMDKEGGIKHPLAFLLASSTLSSIISGIITLKVLSFPATMLGIFASHVLASVVAFGLGRAMGGRGSFEATFKIYAYASCLAVLTAVPILNLIGLYGIFLAAYGIKEVQKIGSASAFIIAFLTGFIMVLVSIAHYFHII